MVLEISPKALDCMRTASLDEAADLLRKIAGTGQADESKKAVIRRLTRKLTDWSENRIKDVLRRDRRVRVRAEEVDQLRALAEPHGKVGVGNELEELRSTVARLAKYEGLLQRIDAEFYGPEISAARDQIGQAGSVLGARSIRLRPGPAE